MPKILDSFEFDADGVGATGCDTNLAAEFYVLSVLHRLGLNATLTLGNKKRVDIVIALDAGKAITIDVKGLRGTTNWPIDNLKEGRDNHFIIFVTFRNKISDPSILPEVYIVPSKKVTDTVIVEDGTSDLAVYENPGKSRRVIQVRKARKLWKEYQDNWKLLVE
jgi:hypothetical protein